MVRISVIIPVYNVEKYLNECLDSVVNQTFDDFEVICVNDGSTDGSLDILNEYAEKHDFIKIITQKNGGLGSARNTGLSASKGEFILFLDSDDYIALDSLERTYENIVSNNSDLAFFKSARFDNDGVINKKTGFDFEKIFKGEDFSNFTFDYSKIRRHVLNSSFAAWYKLYRRSFLSQYDDFIFPEGAYEDVLFHVKCVLRAKRISYVDSVVYYYRNNPTSIVNSNNGMAIIHVVGDVEKFLSENDLLDEFDNEFKLFKITQILNYLLISQSEEYFQTAKDAFKEISSPENIDNINDYKVKRFNLVLECENLYEYYMKHFNIIIDDLKSKNTDLNKMNKDLIDENSRLKKSVEELESHNSENEGFSLKKLISLKK